MSNDEGYNGWANYNTWNVGMWLHNEYGLYLGAKEYMRNYKGQNPYKDFCVECGLDTQKTGDNINWISGLLDYDALNNMMRELLDD